VSGQPRAKRSLGQNFLVDPNIVRKIVAAADIRPADAVLEIGPGRGALTDAILSAKPRLAIALEKDRELAPALAEAYPRLEVINADALRFGWERLHALAPIKVLGNLPYNVASPIMWDFVSQARGWERAVFMVQHEVGRRLVAEPGTADYGALSVWIRSFARVEYLFKVPPTVFRPRPKVDSAVIGFRPLPDDVLPSSPEALANLVKYCFQRRRKRIAGTLKAHFGGMIAEFLEEAGLPPGARPENLSPEHFQRLSSLAGKPFHS
jgi:16S rRNA (adenine1518-N6/adenine1519-N6)-dimethyltransferase